MKTVEPGLERHRGVCQSVHVVSTSMVHGRTSVSVNSEIFVVAATWIHRKM